MKKYLIVIITCVAALLLVLLKLYLRPAGTGVNSIAGRDIVKAMNNSAVGKEMKFHKRHIPLSKTWEFRLYEGDSPVPFVRALELLEHPSSHFRQLFAEQLATVPLEAFFWETPPFSFATVANIPFQFVLISADSLLGQKSNPLPFSSQFKSCEGDVAIFWNTGKDAQLVVPCPLSGEPSQAYPQYGHLASFVRGATMKQIDSLLQQIAVTVHQRLDSYAGSIWLSTSGLGVQWVHVRLDTTPKYYNWEPYKTYRT